MHWQYHNFDELVVKPPKHWAVSQRYYDDNQSGRMGRSPTGPYWLPLQHTNGHLQSGWWQFWVFWIHRYVELQFDSLFPGTIQLFGMSSQSCLQYSRYEVHVMQYSTWNKMCVTDCTSHKQNCISCWVHLLWHSGFSMVEIDAQIKL